VIYEGIEWGKGAFICILFCLFSAFWGLYQLNWYFYPSTLAIINAIDSGTTLGRSREPALLVRFTYNVDEKKYNGSLFFRKTINEKEALLKEYPIGSRFEIRYNLRHPIIFKRMDDSLLFPLVSLVFSLLGFIVCCEKGSGK